MNRKQLILLLIALLVVGSAGLVLYMQHRDSWSEAGAKMGDKVLPNFHPNDVAAIRIKGATELNLIHKGGVWRVAERYDYPANFGRISDALIKLQNIKIMEADTVGASQLSRVNLDDPGQGSTSGILVEFKDADGKLLEALLLGKKHMPDQGDGSRALGAGDPDGRYILLRKDPRTVFLISDGLVSLDPHADSWLNRDFFKVESAKSISLTSTNPADSWKISRETDSSPWTIADAKAGETLDGKKLYMITNSLASPRFTDVVPPGDPSVASLEKPMIVSVDTFDHFSYTLKISLKGADDNYRIKVEVTGQPSSSTNAARLQEKLKQEQSLSSWVYVVNSWILDPVTRARAQILEGYQDPKPANTAETAPKQKPAWTPRVIQ
jgi:Domain of unknown function (DUF4340)